MRVFPSVRSWRGAELTWVAFLFFFAWFGFCALAEPLPDPSKFVPRAGEPEKLAQRRRHADFQAEYNAVTCVAIYMLVMAFSQKGIEELRRYQEHMEMRHPEEDFVVSEGFDDGAFCVLRVCGPRVCRVWDTGLMCVWVGV